MASAEGKIRKKEGKRGRAEKDKALAQNIPKGGRPIKQTRPIKGVMRETEVSIKEQSEIR